MKAYCVSCKSIVFIEHIPILGTLVRCHKCDTHLEVIWLDPLELDWPTESYVNDYDDYFESEFEDE